MGSLEGSSQSKFKFINARGDNESTQPPKTGVSSSEGRESEYFYSTPFQTDLFMFMCYLCKIKLIFLKYYDCVKSKGSEKEKKKIKYLLITVKANRTIRPGFSDWITYVLMQL